MLFAFPYAWLGAAALAGLVAVYLLRSRHRPRDVSSLMLWRAVALPRQGGLRRDTLRLPPLFYLELAALAALVVAAAAPHVRRPAPSSLTVVFDASASMSARGRDGASAQARAAQALRREVGRRDYWRARLLAAGALGPELAAVTRPAQAAAQAERVACCGGADALSQALARARAISEPGDDVLVLTDHAPPEGWADAPQARWLALGQPLANAAITYADRSWQGDGGELLLVEVTGFGVGAARLSVAEVGREKAPLFVQEMKLAEARPVRSVVALPPGAGPVRAWLSPDAADFDNSALLVPQRPRWVSVGVRLQDRALAASVTRAVESSGRALLGREKPQLVFVDGGGVQADAQHWQVALCAPESPRLLRGPYLVDREHPLLEGVTLDGLVWAVGTNQLAGRGLAFAGSAPLLTLEASARRTPVLRVLAGSVQATLFQSAAWPALVWNALDACAASQPGPSARNMRVGEQAAFVVGRGESSAVFETPSGERSLRARGGRVTWSPPEPGLYRLRMQDAEAGVFAANLFAPGESDLRSGASGEWGGGARGERLARTHRSYAWAAGAAALALAALHHWALSRRAAGGPPP